MPGVSFHVDLARLRGVLKRTPEALRNRLSTALDTCGEEFRTTMIKERFRGYTNTPGDKIQNRSGYLRRSIGFEVGSRYKMRDMYLRVFSAGTKYARIQEEGGVVYPKPPNKFLTVPIDDNLTPSGLPRYPSARELKQEKPGSTFVFKGPLTGKLFIVMKENGDLKFLWQLVKKVELSGPRAPSRKGPSRFGFKDTWNRLRTKREERLNKAVNAAIRDAFQ